MPGWRIHAYVDRIWFGRSYWKIHRRMDEPIVYFGRKHRILFHDVPSACMIAERCYPGDPHAVTSALLHISIDQQCSEDPEYRKFLERMEMLDRNERLHKKKRKTARQAPVKHDEIQRTIADLKKIEEARRLIRAFHSL